MNGNAVKSVRTAYKIIRLVFIVLAVVFILLFLIFCRVKADKISISGNIPLDGEKVLSASGITEGTHLYAIDKNEIESGIVSAFSYISSVRIKRSLPCSLNIYIYKEIPAFCLRIQRTDISFSTRELRIIEINKISGRSVYGGCRTHSVTRKSGAVHWVIKLYLPTIALIPSVLIQ